MEIIGFNLDVLDILLRYLDESGEFMIRILNKILLIVLLLLPIFVVRYLELHTNYFDVLGSFLYQREIQSELISYAYITMFIVILTMSSIIFAIILSMTQIMSTRVSYQSYENKILKDRKSIVIFMYFALISFVLLIVYLFADFTYIPLTYIAVLLISFITIVMMIAYLYRIIFVGFSLYSIVEERYNEIIAYSERYQKTINYSMKLIEKLKSISKLNKLKWVDTILLKYFEKRKEKVIRQRNDYDNKLDEIIKEYSFIASNAFANNDIDLYRHILKHITKVGTHRFEMFGSNIEANEFLGMIGIVEQYDRFIENHIIPFYFKFLKSDTNSDLIKYSNEEFSDLLISGDILKYSNADNYNFTLYISMELYVNAVKKQIDIGYQEAILDYANTILRVIDKFDPKSSRRLYRKIAEDVLELAAIAIKNLPIVNYIHLSEVLNHLTSKNLIGYDEHTLEFMLEKQIELLGINLQNVDRINDPFSVSTLNKNWIDSMHQQALQTKLRNLYNTKYSDNIKVNIYTKEMHDILDTILRTFERKRATLFLACNFDRMFLLSFTNLLFVITEIIRIYILNDVHNFDELLKRDLMLYSSLSGNLKATKPFDFDILFESLKDIVAESFGNDSLFGISFDGLINLSVSSFKNIDEYKYSSRCFDDVIWTVTFDGKEGLLDTVLSVLDRCLNSYQLEVFINDFRREKDGLQFGGNSLYKYESLIRNDEALLNKIEEALKELLSSKQVEESLISNKDEGEQS